MSVFTYNGITLPYAYHTTFRQEAQYDESNTDWFCTKFDITLQTIINHNYLQQLYQDLLDAGAPVTENPATIMAAVRNQLLQPRRQLQVLFNGVNLIPTPVYDSATSVDSAPGTVDAQNGPHPQSCELTMLTNTSFLMTYHIVAQYWENTSVDPDATEAANDPIVSNIRGGPVLYNRWSETVDLDETLMTTRTRDGKFVIRSDNFEGKIAAEFMPQMCVVGVPAGFTRQSSHYTITPDGLAIQYRVVDKEQYKMPPPPAYVASGEYVETSSNDGAVRHGEVHVRLKGEKTTPQDLLIEAAAKVCAAKLRVVSGVIGPGGLQPQINLLEFAVIRASLYTNEVEVVMRAWLPATGQARKDGIWSMFDYTAAAFTPGSDGINYQPTYQLRGTASRLLLAARYYDPSLLNNQLVDSQLNHGVNVGEGGRIPGA